MRSFWIYILVVVGAALAYQSLHVSDDRIPFARFRDMAVHGQLADVEIKSDTYIGRTTSEDGVGSVHVYRTGRIDGAEHDLLARLDERGVPYTRVPDDHSTLLALFWLVPIAAGIAIFASSTKKGTPSSTFNPALSFGKNKARLYVDRGTPVTFRDVAGSEETKAELAEIVEFLRSPERFRKLGARVPKGVLLVGPPGTGKTLLAKAVAGEASVPFFSICGSEFVEMFVGVGAARVRDLFSQAREKPASIIFVDELDAVGKTRGLGGPIGGNDEREQTLNQLLTEMDGFESHTGMIVLAATNRPEILDPALLRPGRFDRRVHVDRPDQRERRAILGVHARKVVLGPGVSLDAVAAQTSGLVGADLANVVNEAALLAARRRAEAIEQRDLDEAIERAIAGHERRCRRIGARERVVIAHHEAGHALAAALLPTQDPVRKVSIIPRGAGALGYTMQQPDDDRYLMGRAELLDRLVVLLAGRAAEREAIGEISTGAQDDLVKASDLARRVVRELGMSDVLGPLSLPLERTGPADYSDATARAIDEEVGRLLSGAETRAASLMRSHKATLGRIANGLLERETLRGDELLTLLQEPA